MHDIKTESGKMMMLGPGPNVCQKCAKDHLEHQPHDAQSFYYQMYMINVEQREATRATAMEHCSDAIKRLRTEKIESYGIDINSTRVSTNKDFISNKNAGK